MCIVHVGRKLGQSDSHHIVVATERIRGWRTYLQAIPMMLGAGA